MRLTFLIWAVLGAAPALAQWDCHGGIVAGQVIARSQHVPDGAVPLTDTFDVNGRALGAAFGCLHPLGGWRHGFAMDLMDSNAKGDAQMRDPNQNFFSETSFEWFATLRAVGGYEFASGWAPYITGGIAFASVRMRLCRVAPAFCVTDSQSMWGLVGGAGVRYRLSRRFSANLEYLYFGFEDQPFSKSGALVAGDRDVSVNPEAHLVRLGLSFHF